MVSENSKIRLLPDPSAPLTIKLLYQVLSKCKRGRLHITVDAETYLVEGKEPGPDANITIHKSLKIIKKLSRDGDIGFAEAYMQGEWDTSSLSDFLYWATLNLEELSTHLEANFFIRLFNRLRHITRRNSQRGSRRNISAHYDLGNDFYQLWLDSTMTYSSAIFADPADSLEQAQTRKYELLLSSLGATPGQHILEVGCGWGGFAEHAAKQGYKVTGVTLSTEQLTWGQQRIRDAGFDSIVDLRLQDYRDIEEQFDHIVSIEMFEAVGETYWPGFFEMLFARLKSGGKIALQTITIDEQYFDHYRQNVDFIQRYIFPGGMLPSPEIFSQHAEQAGLKIEQATNYGSHYEQTVLAWHQRFNDVVHQVEDLGYDEQFIRMWRYYLSYCEAGFRQQHTGVYQYLMSKPH
ncbi:MAG: class I SAM-dependent methyltransferase [Methylophagaceae bacterium]